MISVFIFFFLPSLIILLFIVLEPRDEKWQNTAIRMIKLLSGTDWAVDFFLKSIAEGLSKTAFFLVFSAVGWKNNFFGRTTNESKGKRKENQNNCNYFKFLPVHWPWSNEILKINETPSSFLIFFKER